MSTKTDSISLAGFSISKGFLIALLYLFMSILMNLNNRILFNVFEFKGMNFLLMLSQQIVTCFSFNVIFTRFSNYKKVVGECSFKEFSQFAPTILFFSGLFIANILSSFYGNQLVNTAMFLVLRKFLTLFSFTYKRVVKKETLPDYFTHSVILICTGALLSGFHDLTYSVTGYVVVFVNNFLSCLYAVKGEEFKSTYGFTNLKLLVYISFVNIPILTGLAFFNGEFSRLAEFSSFTPSFFLVFGFSCFGAMIINASYFMSNQQNSTLFTHLMSNSKDIFISMASALYLQDFELTFFTMGGVVCSTLGALLFTAKTILKHISKEKVN